MIHWPLIETSKPHLYWRKVRWYVQANRHTNPILFGDALHWSAEQFRKTA